MSQSGSRLARAQALRFTCMRFAGLHLTGQNPTLSDPALWPLCPLR